MRTKRIPAKEGATPLGYMLFFAAELLAMGLILWDGVPIFRGIVNFRRSATLSDDVILFLAALIIQITYWHTLRRDPPFPLPEWQFAGHIILFLSRLSFIFVSAVFSFVVYRYWGIFEFSLHRFVLMILILFAVFCFSRHLEAIGSLMNTGHKPRRRRR